MKHLLSEALFVASAVLWSAATVSALDPAVMCEASKLKTAGKYDFCRLNEAAKAARTLSQPDFGKCDDKFSDKWAKAQAQAMGQCLSTGDEAAVQAFVTQHTDDLAVALAGGPLPDCSGDLVTCNASLGTCTGSLSTCNSSLSTCNTILTATAASLTECNADLTTCSGDFSTCNASLGTVTAGTAAQADVLSGQTFSSGAGIGLNGTMPNNGAVNITPGTSAQTIAAGYHNGAGSVVGDADLVAGNIKSGVNLFGVTGALAGLPESGETASYGTGSDGDLQKGTARSFADNGDGTITDNATGLMWEKKSDDGSIHDQDNTYTWGVTSSPYTMNGTMVTTFLAALNAGGGFAGHTDWRIPNRVELESIVSLEHFSPAVFPVFNTACVATCTVTSCSCTQSTGEWVGNFDASYWSSSTGSANTPHAWLVNFFDGAVGGYFKNENRYVRAVRGGS